MNNKIPNVLIVFMVFTMANSANATDDIEKYIGNQYKIFVGDPYGVRGPKDISYISVTPISIVHGPVSPNWQPADILFKLTDPVEHKGELIEFVTASPRYEGDTLMQILEKETHVGVGRVLPSKIVSDEKRYKKTDIEYWAIGTIRPMPHNKSLNQDAH